MTTLLAGGPPPAVRGDAHLGRGIVRVWSNDLDGAVADLAAADRADELERRREGLRPGRPHCWPGSTSGRTRPRWPTGPGGGPRPSTSPRRSASVVDDAGDAMLVALPHAVAAFVLAGMGRVETRRPISTRRPPAEATG